MNNIQRVGAAYKNPFTKVDPLCRTCANEAAMETGTPMELLSGQQLQSWFVGSKVTKDNPVPCSGCGSNVAVIRTIKLHTETYYAWRELAIVEGEGLPRYLIPHADPMVYEFPIDGLFDTPEQAKEWLTDYEDAADEARASGWVLIKLVEEGLEVFV